MKNFAVFLKTTILGGLFVLLPLLLLYLMLSEGVDLVITLANPVIELLPAAAFDDPGERAFLALVIIIILSFLIGLLSRSKSGRSLGQWFEKSTLNRLPAYDVLKKMTQGFTDSADNIFKPALFESGNGVRDLVYMVEDHGNGKVTILLPHAPTAFTGPVKIVEQDKVELLNANLAEFTKVLSQWGVGTAAMKSKNKSV
jgi:uncharacterized membrane protein